VKVGDRVTREAVLRTENPVGTIIKITLDYVIVRWDNINGDWHYTHEQAKKLEFINESG